MIKNDKLLERLEGKRICWHANCLESQDDPNYAFADLLVGYDSISPYIKAPEVFLHTDHRFGCEESFVFPWEERVYASNNPNAVIKAAKVHRVADLGMLDGYSGKLGHSFNAPEFGHAVECRVTLQLHDDATLTRTVIFVCAETVEFALKFLIPNELHVTTLWQRGYHAGFNYCQTNGSILRRLAIALGTRWYYDGPSREGVNNAALLPGDHILETFSVLEQIEPAALARVPILDRRFVTAYDPEDGQTQEAWFVGQTGESAIYTAGLFDVQAGSETVEGEGFE